MALQTERKKARSANDKPLRKPRVCKRCGRKLKRAYVQWCTQCAKDLKREKKEARKLTKELKKAMKTKEMVFEKPFKL